MFTDLLPPPDLGQFRAIQEFQDEFLQLFPHRYDFIHAAHPAPGDKPQWQTESRYPLSDRKIQEGAKLYGVRFGALTRYLMLDIDKGSPYHPTRDPHAIPRLLEALEPLGLVTALVCTSSYSGGLHLYFPFEAPQKSWQLARAVKAHLEQKGYKVQSGQLELFPNDRTYTEMQPTSLYAAHRLPLQTGSYILDPAPESPRGWTMAGWSQSLFVQRWKFAARRNDVTTREITAVLDNLPVQYGGLSQKAQTFLDDLNEEIAAGWSGRGQTNHLLGRIAMRSLVFGHITNGGDPLSGDRLVQEIVQVAVSLPGYHQYCAHQHEIYQRAAEWTRSVEASHYYPYGTRPKRKRLAETAEPQVKLTANDLRSQHARERIRWAIADLLNRSELPARATDRYSLLTQNYGIGGGTLYKHRDLWHPEHLWKTPEYQSPESIEANSAEAAALESSDLTNQPLPDSALGASSRGTSKSLLDNLASNPVKPLSNQDSANTDLKSFEIASNSIYELDYQSELEHPNLEPIQGDSGGPVKNEMTTEEGIAHIKGILAKVKAVTKPWLAGLLPAQSS